MKNFFLVLLGLQIFALPAHADITAEIAACNSISMALLAKDNYPYWANDAAPSHSVKKCYALLKDAALNASPSQLENLNSQLHIKTRIFFNDSEFAQFINEHRPSQAKFIVTLPKSTSLTPAIKPAAQ